MLSFHKTFKVILVGCLVSSTAAAQQQNSYSAQQWPPQQVSRYSPSPNGSDPQAAWPRRDQPVQSNYQAGAATQHRPLANNGQTAPSQDQAFRYPSSLLNSYRPNANFDNQVQPLAGTVPQGFEALPPAASVDQNLNTPLNTPTVPDDTLNPPAAPYSNQPMAGDQSYFDPEVAGYGGSCDTGIPGPGAPACGPWIGGIGFLFMGRDYETNARLSFHLNNLRGNAISSRNAELNTMPGAEVSFGRCCANGLTIMATYWGLYPSDNWAMVTGEPNTHLRGLDLLDYTIPGVGTATVHDMFNSAEAHRVYRQNEFHNAEINLFAGSLCSNFCSPCCNPCGGCETDSCGCGPGTGTAGAVNGAFNRGLGVTWFVGARYFRFEENFQYAASQTGAFVNDPQEMYYDIDVTNDLFGMQFGGLMQYQCSCKCSLFASTRVGMYYNYLDQGQRIYGASGTSIINTCSYTGTHYDLESNKHDMAMIGEFQVGVGYCIMPCLRATVSYRVLGVSGVALAPNQIPTNFNYVPEVLSINSDGSLLLHGGYCGIEWAF